jgi:hypothetical protein
MQAVHITIHYDHEFMSSTDFLWLIVIMHVLIVLVFASTMLQISK